MVAGSKSSLASFFHQQTEKWIGHHVVVWRCDSGKIEFSQDARHAHLDPGGQKHSTILNLKDSYSYGLCVILHGSFEYINPSMTKDNRNSYVISTEGGAFDEEKGFSFKPQCQLKPVSWMQYLSKDLSLDKVTLPGTRYSCASNSNIDDADVHIEPEDHNLTQSIKQMHKHHEDSISQQLKKGIRLLDICCGVDNFVSHGPLTIANTYVEDALDVVKRFLERNNTETVVVLLNWSSSSLKVLDSDKPWQQGGHSKDDEAIPPRFNRYMKTILKDDKFYYTGNTWPKIKDVRGKAVIACGWNTDHHGHGDRWGVTYKPPKWQPARFSTHQYTPSELIDEKWEKIKNELHTHPEKHRAIVLAASLQHDPKTTKGWIVPRDTAAELQKQLRCHIDDGKKKIGGLWVFGDFMERETIMAISKLNWEGYNQDDRRRQVHVVSPHSKAQQALWRNQAAQALQGAM